MNQHVDFRCVDGINRIGDSYLPSPIRKKSQAIAALQLRWERNSPVKPKRNFKINYEADLTTRPIYRSPPPPPCTIDLDDLPPSKIDLKKGPGSPTSVMQDPIMMEEAPSPYVVKCLDADSEGEDPAKEEVREVDRSGSLNVDRPKTVPVRSSSLKSSSSLKRRSKTPEKRRVQFVEPKVYKSWDFGKKKTFSVPKNASTNAAATKLQRIARGGMQRLHYRVLRLEHMLATRVQRTQASLDEVEAHTEQRKEMYKQKMVAEQEKELNKLDLGTVAAQESQKIIAYLRKENRKLREKNDKVFMACHNLREQNARLESANAATEDSFATLKAHAKQIEETHRKLKDIVPKYEASVRQLQDAVEERRQYCLSEHKIKIMYTKLVGGIVDKVESSRSDEAVADEVVESVLELESLELHNEPVPPSVQLAN